jgi:hypothetical protein
MAPHGMIAQEELLYAIKHGLHGFPTSALTGHRLVSWAAMFLNGKRSYAVLLLNQIQDKHHIFARHTSFDDRIIDSKSIKYKIQGVTKRVIILGNDTLAIESAKRLEHDFEVILVESSEYGFHSINATRSLSHTKVISALVQHVGANRVFFDRESTCVQTPSTLSFDYLIVCPSAFCGQEVTPESTDSLSKASLIRMNGLQDTSMFKAFIPCALDAADQVQTNERFQVASNAAATTHFSNIFALQGDDERLLGKEQYFARYIPKVISSLEHNDSLPAVSGSVLQNCLGGIFSMIKT